MPSARSARSEPALDFLRLMWAVDHELQSVSKRMLAGLGLTGPQRLSLTRRGQGVNRRRSGTIEAAVRRALASTPDRDVRATGRVLKLLAIELGAEVSGE